jgi:hypothetical protein
MRLRLVRNPEHWERYKKTCRLSENDPVPEGTQWGSGPEKYPALVASVFYVDRVFSCYVYPDDARRLLSADIDDSVPDGEGLSVVDQLTRLQEAFAAFREETSLAITSLASHARMHLKRAFETGYYDSMESYEKAHAAGCAYLGQMDAQRRALRAPRTLHGE